MTVDTLVLPRLRVRERYSTGHRIELSFFPNFPTDSIDGFTVIGFANRNLLGGPSLPLRLSESVTLPVAVMEPGC